MIQARVITGEYCQGRSDLKAAPFKPSKNSEKYDSVVDNIGKPTMYVVFDDAAAYPEYIIKFK